MKHAVLIMAHKNPDQVSRLIGTLNCSCFDFYVHFDEQFQLTEDDITKIKNAGDNVVFCENRIHGELDRWSLPQITLNLIDMALSNEQKTDIQYSYFLLLSGQDYPIKSNEYICEFLERNYPRPLIDIEKYREGTWLATKFKLVKWVRRVDEVHSRFSPGIYRKFRVAPYVIAEFLEKHFRGTPYDRLKKMGIDLWGGSAWWILPHEVMDYLHKFCLKKKVMRELKNTWTPEETFFQIVTMSSPLADMARAECDVYQMGDQRCMTYANFTTPTKPFRGHPHVITVEDFDRIMKKKQLFARKFDATVDEKVLNRIDDVINSQNWF